MEEIGKLIALALGVMLVNNYVLARFLGLCPFIGVTKNMKDAFGMGVAVSFVMAMASLVTYAVYTYLLHPGAQNLVMRLCPAVFEYTDAAGAIQKDPFVLERVLRTSSYILSIAGFVQFVEMVLKKTLPVLYRAMGIYLPLITTNCAVLGVALLNTTDAPVPLNILEATWQGFFAGVGFTIAMLLMAGIRERLELAPMPRALRDWPIAFICTGLMAISFLGFSGMV